MLATEKSEWFCQYSIFKLHKFGYKSAFTFNLLPANSEFFAKQLRRKSKSRTERSYKFLIPPQQLQK